MQQVRLSGKRVRVVLNDDLSLAAFSSDGQLIWESSRSRPPAAVVLCGSGKPRSVALSAAGQVSVSAFDDGAFHGSQVRLEGIEGADVVLEMVVAMDPDQDEIMLQAAQVGGADTVVGLEHLYRWEKPVADGGYVALPHGSGYLIPADCPDELPGEGIVGGTIGGRWSMPLFGMVKGDESLVAIVDTWWDCEVFADHVPGELSALDFHWAPSLGKLAYPRRIRYRFAQDMDHVGMAKLYREQARSEGLVRTLREKMEETPQIERYVEGILFRWGGWNPPQIPAVLEQTRKLVDRGMQINFFFPKWPAEGYSKEKSTATTANGLWQAFLHPSPVPGGWASLADFDNKLRDMGCLIQGFVCPMTQVEGAPEYDPLRFPMKEDGTRHEWFMSVSDDVERNQAVLQSLKDNGLQMDVLYYDGYSAHMNLPEDFSPEHPCSLRDVFETESRCLADTRRAGIMPAAELARFWAMRDCDFWFFTDWSADRLANTDNQGCAGPVGEPIPWFELVFHDCHLAGFSGGGYGLYNPGYDWWEDRNPRLYELLFVAAPSHNWLPEGAFPYEKIDAPEAETRWDWLRKMAELCKATKFSEMTSHKFLSEDRKQQRVEFANGVVAEFDMAANRFRVQGVELFTGDWEAAPDL